jgi:lysophospholipase L1-like esterase
LPNRSRVVLALGALAFGLTATTAPPVVAQPTPAASPDGPFRPKTIVSLGDSITQGVNLPDPGTQAYPYLLAAHYGASVADVAIGGAAAGSERSGDVIRTQLGHVRAPCDLATLNIGTNDIRLMAHGDDTVADYEADVGHIVTALRGTCTRVVVMTVIDNPWNLLATGECAAVWATDVASENAFLRSLAGVTVVDLNADPRMHDQSSFGDPGLLHPGVAGQQYIADDIESSL